MQSDRTEALVLEDRHTGERLVLRRVVRDGETCLEIRGSLPPGREGPPLHTHLAEDEEGRVLAGRLSAVVGGRRIDLGPGEPMALPRRVAHRWWNEGEETLEFLGYARPVIDLDRYLQAMFEVSNAGPADRPPFVYLAHALWRHRKTQRALAVPWPVQAVVLPLAVLVGTLLGRYRGTDWPGCPARCVGAPSAVAGAPEVA